MLKPLSFPRRSAPLPSPSAALGGLFIGSTRHRLP